MIKYNIESMDISRGALVDSINGDYWRLEAAFVWGETPQGESYWSVQWSGDADLAVGSLKEILFQYDNRDTVIFESDLEEKPREFNPVDKPSHYGQGEIECIDYIEDFLTKEEYIGYLRGNIAKYMHRWRYKNGLEDLKKAKWYLERLIEVQRRM